MIRTTLPPENEPTVDKDGKMTVSWRSAIETGGGLNGYGVATGSFSRVGFATYVAPVAAATLPALQMQVQTLMNAFQALSETVAAHQNDLRST